MKRNIILFIILIYSIGIVAAQNEMNKDSLTQELRGYTMRNFTQARTFSLQWETRFSHNYSVSNNGSIQESGKKQNIHHINFSAMLPLLRRNKLSIHIGINYKSYNFDLQSQESFHSSFFPQNDYDYFSGNINAAYRTSLWKTPLFLYASVTTDGWSDGFGKIYGRVAAMMVLKRTEQSRLTVGVMGMTLFRNMPVYPIITYWHVFSNSKCSLDITLPSQIFLRYCNRNNRISVGAAMRGEGFYCKIRSGNTRYKVCYFTEATYNPELVYEYIINKHLHLSISGGYSLLMNSGFYDKDRKNVKIEGRKIGMKFDRKPTPFFNLNVSYTL